MRGRRCTVLSGLAVLTMLTACAAPSGPAQPSAAQGSRSAAAQSWDPSRSSEVYLPSGVPSGARVPVVVTIPGGGWWTADRTGLVGLARGLAAAGDLVVNATYRAGEAGAHFPVPLQDVRCDAAYAVAAARRAGYQPGPVVLLGHSAGGHLVALAAVSGDSLAAPCADPVPHIDGVVGLAGVYDTAAFATYMTDFFGVSRADDPGRWDSGDPIHYVDGGRVTLPLRVLLIHGDIDSVVPPGQSTAFARALREHGIPVQLEVLAGQTHMSLIRPDVTLALVSRFVREVAAG